MLSQVWWEPLESFHQESVMLPCQPARSARSDPSPPLEPTLTPLSPRGSSAPWKGSPSQAPPWRERLPNFVADLGPGWGTLPLGADAPTPEGRGSEPQEAPSPGGFPKRGPFRDALRRGPPGGSG